MANRDQKRRWQVVAADAQVDEMQRAIEECVVETRRDAEIDQLYTSLFRELLVYMIEDPAAAVAVHLVFCTKNLERMGDHATDIAEAVYYMVKGHMLGQERPKADGTSVLASASGGSLNCGYASGDKPEPGHAQDDERKAADSYRVG